MQKFKYLVLLSLFAGIIMVSCTRTEREKYERVLSFDRNVVETREPELVCLLSEDSILIGQIKDFTLLNDTSFVVVDGRGAYLYHISGTFIKRFGHLGRAEGEMLSPSAIYSNSNFVYIWCSTLLKILIFDNEAHFKKELSGFARGVQKFVVDPNDEIVYLYTSGFCNKSGSKTIDVITTYDIAEKLIKESFGERGGEDEVLFVSQNSSGLYADMDRLIYLHPGNLIVYNLDLNSDKTTRYKIKDKAFWREQVTDSRKVVNDRHKLFDYLFNNSVVRGFHKDGNQYIIIADIGKFDFDEQRGFMEIQKNRKIKLYIFDSAFNPIRTILFDYFFTPNIMIYSGAMYFLSLNLDGENQKIMLNRFSLSI